MRYVSPTPATRVDVINLQDELDEATQNPIEGVRVAPKSEAVQQWDAQLHEEAWPSLCLCAFEHATHPLVGLLRIVEFVLVQQLVLVVDDAAATLAQREKLARGFAEPADALQLDVLLPGGKVVGQKVR